MIMKTVIAYPITTGSCPVFLPPGAVILDVSLHVHQYRLHVLADKGGFAAHEQRDLVSYLDDDIIADERSVVLVYIGSAAQSGDHRRWSFFERRQAGQKGGAA